MLNVTNLRAGYGKVEVLHGLSLQVRKGEVVALLGSNGAGKTTLLRAVSGLVTPTSGRIVLGGHALHGMAPHLIAGLGVAHCQEGRHVFGNLSVADNLRLGAYTRLTGRRGRGDVAADLEMAMELFPRLKERRHQRAGTLSGGEQQMLAMARALMLDPLVMLLDEPSLGLAPGMAEEVFRIILRLKERRVTMLLVEHSAAAALQVADYGYVLENGRLKTAGLPRQLRSDPALQTAYGSMRTSVGSDRAAAPLS
jgi:branched-chain amino acid transport system ATP-binding protein